MEIKFTSQLLDKIKTINEKANFTIEVARHRKNKGLFIVVHQKKKSVPIESDQLERITATEFLQLERDSTIYSLNSSSVSDKSINLLLWSNEFLVKNFIVSLLGFESWHENYKNKTHERQIKKELEYKCSTIFIHNKNTLKWLGEDLYKDFLTQQLKYVTKRFLNIKYMDYFCNIVTLVKGNTQLIEQLIKDSPDIFEKKSLRINFISSLRRYDSSVGQFADNYLREKYGADCEDLTIHKSVQSLEISVLKIIEQYPLNIQGYSSQLMYNSLTNFVVKKFSDILPQLSSSIPEGLVTSAKGKVFLIINTTENEVRGLNKSLIRFIDYTFKYYQTESQRQESFNYKSDEVVKVFEELCDKFIEKENLDNTLISLNNKNEKKNKLKI